MELLALGLAGESLPPRTDESLKVHPNRWAFTIFTGLFFRFLQPHHKAGDILLIGPWPAR